MYMRYWTLRVFADNTAQMAYDIYVSYKNVKPKLSELYFEKYEDAVAFLNSKDVQIIWPIDGELHPCSVECNVGLSSYFYFIHDMTYQSRYAIFELVTTEGTGPVYIRPSSEDNVLFNVNVVKHFGD